MIPALIGAGASLIGGLFASKKSEQAAKAANATQMNVADRNIELQKQFAREGIQWRVEDAKQAGIHPLAALGAQTHTFSPVAVGSALPDYSGIAQAGQDVSRAIHATRDPGAKLDAYTKTVQDLTVQRMGLENQILEAQLASQIAKVSQPGTPPGIPADLRTRYLIDGQTDSIIGTPYTFEFNEKFERSPSRPNNPTAEFGSVPGWTYERTPNGGLAVIPSKDSKERHEDNWIQQALWNVRHYWRPLVNPMYRTPTKPNANDYPLPDHLEWRYNGLTATWYPAYKRGKGGGIYGIPPPPTRRPR